MIRGQKNEISTLARMLLRAMRDCSALEVEAVFSSLRNAADRDLMLCPSIRETEPLKIQWPSIATDSPRTEASDVFGFTAASEDPQSGHAIP